MALPKRGLVVLSSCAMAKKKAKRHGSSSNGSVPPAKGPEAESEAAASSEGDVAKDDGAEESSSASERSSDAKDDAPASGGAASAKAEDDAAKEESAAAAKSKTDDAEEESAASAGAATKTAPAAKGKPWGEPIARFEAGWTRLETKLITWVLVAQLLSMVAWVLLSGLSSPIQSGNASGLVMRAVLGAVGLGLGAWFATKNQTLNVRRGATIGGIVVGLLVAKLWRTVGVEYFDNVKAWLQEGSMITLMGGLRGVATRLTLWLALLGASLATGAGKHINIDVVFRFVPARLRKPIAITNYAAAALVCSAAVWGFFDHIAIESYGAKAEDTAGQKISMSAERIGEHFFLARKQLTLDLKSLPHIVKGDRFDRWMSAGEWNAWVKDAGFEAHYPKETVESVLVPDDAPPHTPLVVAPDGESTRGILVHALSLVFPFGMLVLALRFLLRILLVLSGHVELDPDAAHKEEIGHHGAKAAEPQKGGA